MLRCTGILLGVLALGGPLSGNDSPPNTDNASRMQADLIALADQIRDEHPRPFRFIDEPSFNQRVNELAASFDETSDKRDLLWAFSEVIASIGCAHTRMPYFNQEDALIPIAARFPVDVRFVDDRLLVLDALSNGDGLSRGDEIVAINGQPVDQLMQTIYRHIPADAHFPYSKRHLFNTYATSYLTYALGFPDVYAVQVVGSKGNIPLKPLTEFEHKPLVDPNDPCQQLLCYRVDAQTGTGILSLRSFAYYGSQGQEFADFIDAAFADLVQHERGNLIIDVRSNRGGSGLAAAYVLRRLAKAPFRYFSDETDPRARESLLELQRPVDTGFGGTTFVLMDGNTVSSVPHFLALIREHEFAFLVGEPAGGNGSTNDGSLDIQSTEFGIQYSIARMAFEIDTPSWPTDAPIAPDMPMPYTIAQTLGGEDVMLQSLLREISRQ